MSFWEDTIQIYIFKKYIFSHTVLVLCLFLCWDFTLMDLEKMEIGYKENWHPLLRQQRVAKIFNEAKGCVTASISKVQGYEISKFSTFSVTVHSLPSHVQFTLPSVVWESSCCSIYSLKLYIVLIKCEPFWWVIVVSHYNFNFQFLDC